MAADVAVHFTLDWDAEGTWPVATQRVMRLPPWASLPSSAEMVIEVLCRSAMDGYQLDQQLDSRGGEACLWVTITAPEWLQGRYAVVMRKILTIESRKLVARESHPPTEQGEAHA